MSVHRILAILIGVVVGLLGVLPIPGFWWIYTVLADTAGEKSWLEQNTALVVALIALVSAIAQAVFGIRAKRTVAGGEQLDDERQYRQELRTENKDLKAEKAELEKQIEDLSTRNKELRKEAEHCNEVRERLQGQVATLTSEGAEKDSTIKRLEANILRLNSQITNMENKGNGG